MIRSAGSENLKIKSKFKSNCKRRQNLRIIIYPNGFPVEAEIVCSAKLPGWGRCLGPPSAEAGPRQTRQARRDSQVWSSEMTGHVPADPGKWLFSEAHAQCSGGLWPADLRRPLSLLRGDC